MPQLHTLSWDEMIEEFRALGGTADNVVQRVGQYGCGLFPIDPSKPVDIHVPGNLLVPTKWVREDGLDLVIQAEAGFDAQTRAFFTRYQRAFSWGREARQNALLWLEQLESLPDNVRRYLSEVIGISLSDQLDEERVLKRYIVTRRIRYHGEFCLMPIIELINHASHARPYEIGDGIRVRGMFTGEVAAYYSDSDPFRRYFEYGFVSDEKQAFSLSMILPGVGGGTLTVRSNLTTQGTQGVPSILPTVQDSDGGIEISHLTLGNSYRPRVPRSIFRGILPSLSPDQADEAFQRVVGYNIRAFVGLLDVLDGHDDPMCRQLRTVARLQLLALAESYGVRELDSLFNTAPQT